MPNIKRRVAGILAGALGAALCSLAATPAHAAYTSSYQNAGGTGSLGPAMGGPITGSQMIARAQDWTTADGGLGVTYSESNGWSDGTVGGGYRTDCSGFVSMAWALGSSYTTYTLPNISTELTSNGVADYSQLQPGDILLFVGNPSTGTGHVELFAGWADSGHTVAGVYEEAHTGTRTSYNTTSISYFSSNGFLPYRYKNLANSEPTASRMITGLYDGNNDFVEVRNNGELWFYTHVTSGGYSSGTRIDSGWGNARLITGLNDGSSDFLEVRTDGTLWLYRNVTAAGYSGATQIDSGWGNARLITGLNDHGGDFLEVRTDGTLWFYSNATTAGYTLATQIDSGWGNATMITGADSGAGDFLETRSDGTLWYYRGANYTGYLGGNQIDSGWGNAREITDVDNPSTNDFLEVRTDGTLWYYSRVSSTGYAGGTRIDSGW